MKQRLFVTPHAMSRALRARRIGVVITGVALCQGAWSESCNPSFCVEEDRAETYADLYLRSVIAEPAAVSMAISTENAVSTRMGAFEVVLPPGKRVKATRIIQDRQGELWHYRYETAAQFSRKETALLPKGHVYRMPLPSGHSALVIQGQGGPRSHTQADHYGLDLQVPVGTSVVAARGGVVVNVRDDSNEGGANRAHSDKANFVIVQHTDGTLARYYHLQEKSVVVQTGQAVRAGDALGKSGATGFVKEPHLHFDVVRITGATMTTIPFLLDTHEGLFKEMATGLVVTAK